ncbi:MAG TPA: GNAT family N-acetyltransferase [Stellaceae bacterium]|nr:GNAT family N-acetyltransferase [Stellaceae bacterium]
MTAPVELRRLGPGDALLYRDIRLEGLADTPHAFAGTLEDERSQPVERFAARLADDVVFGAFGDGELLGVAGFYIQPKAKHRHKGVLWGMYVRRQARGRGIGQSLVEAIIGHARQQVEILQLSVVSDNAPARRLYARLGFVAYGVERHATKYHGQYHDDILMALPLVVESGSLSKKAVTA